MKTANYTELFALAARLVLDDSDFTRGVEAAKGGARKLGDAFGGAESKVTKLSSALNVAQKAAHAIGKAFNFGKQTVQAAADAEAMGQSMAAVFQGIGDEAAEAFARVSEANNINMRRLQGSGLDFFAQFKSAGLDDNNSLHAMEDALGYAADAAAFYNMTMEDASAAIRSFIRGNTEAGDRIGLFINQQKRETMAQEKYKKAWDDLTEAERQYLLLDVIGETYERSNVLGQGSREANNYANAVANLADDWNAAMAKMGEKSLPPVANTLESLSDWMSRNQDIFEKIGSLFGWIVEQAGAAVVGTLEFIEAVDNLVDWGTDENTGKLSAPTPYDKQAIFDEYGNRRNLPPTSMFYVNPADLVDESQLPDVISTAQYRPLPVAVEADMEEDAESKMQRVLDAWDLVADVQGRWVGLAEGGPGLADVTFYDDNKGGTYEKGLSYVPYDNFPARLHRGESVLSRVDAESWRGSRREEKNIPSAEEIAAAMVKALAGVSVKIDGRSAGSLLAPHVSRTQSSEYWRSE